MGLTFIEATVSNKNIKKIDKHTSGELLLRYPEIEWPGVKGVRDILSHDYFSIDAEEIFRICATDLEPLKQTLIKMRTEYNS